MSDPNDSRHSLSTGPLVAAVLYGAPLAGALAAAAVAVTLSKDALPLAALAAAVAGAFAAAGLVAGTAYLMAFRRATERDVRLLAAYGERMARGEYPGAPLPARADRLGELAAALRKLGRLEKALYDVRDLAVSAQGGSGRLDAQIAEALSRISGQASRVEAASAMLEQIVQATQSAHTYARRSLETAEESGQGIAGSAAKLIDGGKQVTELADLAIKVDEAVSLISGIADQTDILSLNAGIEAARAGPSGRGFTVVATEMRKLADKSLRSAQEISALTQSMLGVVQRIAALTDEESLAMSAIQRGLERMTEAAGRVTADAGMAGGEVERLRAALDELASGLAESQRDVGELAKTAQAVHGEVNALRAVSSELGFPISTASFAAWAAEAPEEPPEGQGRGEPRPEPPRRERAAERGEGGRQAPGGRAATQAQEGRGDGAEEEPAELEPVD